MLRLRPLAGLATLAAALAWPAWGADPSTRALSLDEAVTMALEFSPDLASAEQRARAARARLREADAAFYPKMSVSEAYTTTNSPVQAFMMTLSQRSFSSGSDFNDPTTTDNLNTKVLATYSLYNGGRDLAGRQAARLGWEAQELALEAARNDLVFEVERAFHTVGKARRFVEAAEAAVASMGANLDTVRQHFSNGSVLKSDVLDAEVRLAESRENAVRARSALAASELALREVLGVGENVDVTAVVFPSAGVFLSDVDSAGGGGDGAGRRKPMATTGEHPAGSDSDIQQRAEVRAARKRLDAAERRLRLARGGHLPRVNAFAGYDLDSGDTEDFADSWIAGVTVEMEVFGGFAASARVEQRQAEVLSARAELRKTEIALQVQARQARLDLDDARARLATSTRSVAQASESLEITRERYANGRSLLAQVLDAETALVGARQRRAAAEADLLVARAALGRALGRPWQQW